jgi:hypothetical protein
MGGKGRLAGGRVSSRPSDELNNRPLAVRSRLPFSKHLVYLTFEWS